MSATSLLCRAAGVVVLWTVPLVAGTGPAADRGNANLATAAQNSLAPAGNAEVQGIIGRIEFSGLRRIPAQTLRARIRSRVGQALDPAQIQEDVRALDRLGWFDSVSAEVELLPVLLAVARGVSGAQPVALPASGIPGPVLRLVFVLQERPFLAGVEFGGSRVLSQDGVPVLLAEKGISLKVAAPVNRVELWRARRAIERALAESGHPLAKVHVRLEQTPGAAVRAVFEINDGPEIRVGRICFTGDHVFPEEELRKQLKRVAPGATFARLRGKDVYTLERMTEDLERLADFYRDHGYPEARIGEPTVKIEAERVRRWFPWPRRQTAPRYQISIPVDAGRFYRVAAIELHREAEEASSAAADRAAQAPGGLKLNEPYSQRKLERAREELLRSRELRPSVPNSQPPEIEVIPKFDPEAGTVRVSFRVREVQAYRVRRIEFLGHRRFSDRYYRRRILLREGEAFDTRKLELGLVQLARTGFIHAVKPEDINLRLDDSEHLADLSIRVHEIGRQRISLVGGRSAFGSTLGIVYNVFDLFGGEELITGHLEGGPESLQILLGVAKEGLFGTRASLGVSLFQNVLRPKLPGSAGRQRLFTTRSTGLGLAWSYPLTPQDTFGVNYQLAHNSTEYNLPVPAGMPGQVEPSRRAGRASTSSRSLGVTGLHETQRERLQAAASVSGGWLGGDENLLRASMEYSRVLPDPFTDRRVRGNSWAFRGYLSGAGSYQGELPFYTRFFSGGELVRGARPGELGPYALVTTRNPDGSSTVRAEPAGANFVAGINSEYRVPVLPRAELAPFFDAGLGWLLPHWLGANRPTLLGGTNGILRSSTGVEMKVRLPGVEQILRIHYAINPFGLRRVIPLPDGSVFRPPAARAAWGWALGSLF